jgi:hypothetical protein
MTDSPERSLSISCDDCSMQCSSACTDCVVTFLLRDDPVEADHETLVLNLEQARVVKLFSSAGLVPDLKYRVAG